MQLDDATRAHAVAELARAREAINTPERRCS